MKRGKQRYRCISCYHQFCNVYKRSQWVVKAYHNYVLGKQTLSQLSHQYQRSVLTLRKYFDQLIIEITFQPIKEKAIHLVFDATFFSRADGVLVFRAHKKNIYWRFVQSETIRDIDESLSLLQNQGYHFKSFTIDGRKGVIQRLETRFPGIPIQLCQFHQAQIIRRYTTNTPKTECGKELKQLMTTLSKSDESTFSNALKILYTKYHDFLKERNEAGQFVHRRLRSAFRSLKTNLPYLFTYKKFTEQAIPNTTNSCDGSFAHWKQKVKIHRGLRSYRESVQLSVSPN